MSFLNELEDRLEKLVDGIFAKRFQTSAEPMEIARLLKKHMLNHKKISVRNTYVPSSYTVYLSEDDCESLKPIKKKLIDELSRFLEEEAAAEGLTPVAKIKIRVKSDPGSTQGGIDIEVTDDEADDNLPVQPEKTVILNKNLAKNIIGYLEIKGDGKMIPVLLNGTVGRSKNSGICLPSPKISRKHARFFLEDGRPVVEDLGSTNGTFVNGRQIGKDIVRPGDIIQFADIETYFRDANA